MGITKWPYATAFGAFPDFSLPYGKNMIEHLCEPDMCGGGKRETLFDNTMVHDYPQGHYIRTDLPIDEALLQTGMVTSRSQLKRLYKQNGVHLEGNVIRIGQRRLILVRT